MTPHGSPSPDTSRSIAAPTGDAGSRAVPQGSLGALAVPDGPGLGLDPDADVIKDYRVD